MKLFPDVSGFVENMNKRNSTPKASMHSLELVITVVVFILAGRFIDSQFGTTPIFTLIFIAFGAVGSGFSAYYRFNYVSKKLEEDKVWARATTKATAKVTEEEEEKGLVVPKGYGEKDE